MAYPYPLSRVPDRQLLDALAEIVSDKRRSDATLLAHIAEVDRRKLYAAEGYESMFLYCTQVLHLSEGGAYSRITVARAAREYPLIFEKLAAGQIHHSGLRLLVPRLSRDNHRELLDAATHKTKREIEALLAERFPQPDVPATVRALPQRRSTTVGVTTRPASLFTAPAPAQAPAPVNVAPLSPKRFRVELTVEQRIKDKLDRAKALLRHRSPHVDEAEVLDRALDALLESLEKQKFGKTDRPRTCKESDGRYLPADARRSVSERDGERCTYVSASGKRCDATAFLEYDHVVPVARGGKSTVENLRLRCRTHNQYTAPAQLAGRAGERRVIYATRPGTSWARWLSGGDRDHDRPDPVSLFGPCSGLRQECLAHWALRIGIGADRHRKLLAWVGSPVLATAAPTHSSAHVRHAATYCNADAARIPTIPRAARPAYRTAVRDPAGRKPVPTTLDRTSCSNKERDRPPRPAHSHRAYHLATGETSRASEAESRRPNTRRSRLLFARR